MAVPAELKAALAARGLDVSGRWVSLRGGRTNRAWRVGGLVVKLIRAEAANPVFANDGPREYATLAALEGTGLAPQPVALVPVGGADALVYRHVPGRRWRSGVVEVARLLRRLHALPAPASLPAMAGDAASLAAQAAALEAGQPALAAAPEPGTEGPVALLHGDVVPGNIIVTPEGRLCLIDWQCPARGDPALDLATFLSPAMQWLYRGAPLSAGERAAFLAAYDDPATVARYRQIAPAFHRRMVAYCAWKAARGAADYAAARALELEALAGLAA